MSRNPELQSVHPRLDEMVSEFGWRRGRQTEGGALGVENTAQAGVEGRMASLLCYRDRKETLSWNVMVEWRESLSRRQRKLIKKQGDELATAHLSEDARLILTNAVGHHDYRIGMGTGAVAVSAEGEPPSAESVVEIAKLIGALAGDIEEALE